MMYLCSLYPVSDKLNYDIRDIMLCQIIKAIYLFNFLESDGDFKHLLDKFLEHFHCLSWQEYLQKMLPMAMQVVSNNDDNHTNVVIEHNDDFEENIIFFENLIVSHEDTLAIQDFITLRSKPFYRIEEGVYRVIFDLFLVEKIFKGLYFLLRDVNSTLPKKQKISSWRGRYCFEFSEKYLFYKAMEDLYSGGIIYTGEEMEEFGDSGTIDYYVRIGKKVMLFESKDFLIAADKKMSFDYAILEPEFARTLYYEEMPDGKEKAGAVMQLVRNIKRVLRNENTFDSEYRYKDIIIYPVIVVHDHQYDIPGLSVLINDWLNDELQLLKREGLYVQRVRPCTIINIDSLLLYRKFLSGNNPLHALLEEYQKVTKVYSGKVHTSREDVQREVVDKLIPFSVYLQRRLGSLTYEQLPPVLDLVKAELFKK